MTYQLCYPEVGHTLTALVQWGKQGEEGEKTWMIGFARTNKKKKLIRFAHSGSRVQISVSTSRFYGFSSCNPSDNKLKTRKEKEQKLLKMGSWNWVVVWNALENKRMRIVKENQPPSLEHEIEVLMALEGREQILPWGGFRPQRYVLVASKLQRADRWEKTCMRNDTSWE